MKSYVFSGRYNIQIPASRLRSFLNLSNSKRYRDLVRIDEELGVIVTHIELLGGNERDKEAYDDYEEDARS